MKFYTAFLFLFLLSAFQLNAQCVCNCKPRTSTTTCTPAIIGGGETVTGAINCDDQTKILAGTSQTKNAADCFAPNSCCNNVNYSISNTQNLNASINASTGVVTYTAPIDNSYIAATNENLFASSVGDTYDVSQLITVQDVNSNGKTTRVDLQACCDDGTTCTINQFQNFAYINCNNDSYSIISETGADVSLSGSIMTFNSFSAFNYTIVYEYSCIDEGISDQGTITGTRKIIDAVNNNVGGCAGCSSFTADVSTTTTVLDAAACGTVTYSIGSTSPNVSATISGSVVTVTKIGNGPFTVVYTSCCTTNSQCSSSTVTGAFF